jgi:hypothetical protein
MISYTPIRWTGTAPGTLTMQLGDPLGNPLPPCGCGVAYATAATGYPPHFGPASQAAQALPQAAQQAVAKYLYPYGTPGNLKSSLGAISEVEQWRTSQTRHLPVTATIAMGPTPKLLGLVDINDSKMTSWTRTNRPWRMIPPPLGLVTNEIVRSLNGIPNDDELAAARGGCYTPVQSGWVDGINTATGKAYHGGGFYGALGGLGGEPMNVDDVVKKSMALQTTQVWLQAFSTAAILAVATVAVVGCFKAGR